MIERLRRALDDMGYDLGGPEILDVLWLARVMNGGATPSGAGATGPSAPDDGSARPLEPLTGAGAPPPAAGTTAPAAQPRVRV
ncbi:hypothetical protein GT039_02430, partial [Streptomyces sp. SID2955]|nr:hypothetical protein [Streptomyces sp. SID2955]